MSAGKLDAAALAGTGITALMLTGRARLVNPAALANIPISRLDVEEIDPAMPIEKLPLEVVSVGKIDDAATLARLPGSVVELRVNRASAPLELGPRNRG